MIRLVIETREDRLEAARAIARLPVHSVIELRVPGDGTREQMALLWGLLGDLAVQATWNGEELTAQHWHDLIMDAVSSARIVPAIGSARSPKGRMVALVRHASELTKAELTEAIDYVQAFGAERGVTFRYVKPLPENPHA